ncbi:hypothetical protein ACI763_06795, partial [Capnocytophaga canimorsus]|uniref:hypothetical protein n=1 Tax=Capnocytophaga canimorsus TaxID=28188 RepID=UPI00385F3730
KIRFILKRIFFMLRCACPFGRTAAFFKLKLQSFVIGVFCFSKERRCSQARVAAFFKEKADSKQSDFFCF